MNQSVLLSFVIPCYRSEFTIRKVVEEIETTVSQRNGYDYEIIAVNDCSPDNVYHVLEEIAKTNKKLHVINLLKNMGKQAAVLAGYKYVKGDYVVNLDDDYQSPVNELWKLIDLVESDKCDIATALYKRKKENVWKTIGSKFNTKIENIMLDRPKNIRIDNFNVIKRMVCEEAIKYKNPYPYIIGLFAKITDRVITVPMENRERADDKTTGYTLRKSIALFTTGLTNFSVKPLRIALMTGVIFAIFGFVFGIIVMIRKFINPTIAIGWSSIMAVILLSSGFIMMMLGMIGEYIGRIFICINNFPQYVVKNTINVQEK